MHGRKMQAQNQQLETLEVSGKPVSRAKNFPLCHPILIRIATFVFVNEAKNKSFVYKATHRSLNVYFLFKVTQNTLGMRITTRAISSTAFDGQLVL